MPSRTGSNILQTSVASTAASVSFRLCVQHQLGPHISPISPDTAGGDIHPTSSGRLVFQRPATIDQFKCASEWGGKALSGIWMGLADRDPVASYHRTRDYLLAPSGGTSCAISNAEELDSLVRGITILFARMAEGDTVCIIMTEINSM